MRLIMIPAVVLLLLPMAPSDQIEGLTAHQPPQATEQDRLTALSEIRLQRIQQAKQRARAAAQASREAERAAPPASAPAVGLPADLLCVRAHESGGDYTVVNSLGYAGAYQFSPEYWPAWARRYGYGEWAGTHPASVPPNVQDGVALGLWNDGAWVWRAWGDYDCDWP